MCEANFYDKTYGNSKLNVMPLPLLRSYMLSCLLPFLIGEKPTLQELTLIKVNKNGKNINIKIIDSVAPEWKTLAALFNFDKTGQNLKLIEAKYQKEGPVACCQAMFQYWLKGNGKEPTWKVLIELLHDIDESELASQVKAAIEVSKCTITSGYTHLSDTP